MIIGVRVIEDVRYFTTQPRDGKPSRTFAKAHIELPDSTITEAVFPGDDGPKLTKGAEVVVELRVEKPWLRLSDQPPQPTHVKKAA